MFKVSTAGDRFIRVTSGQTLLVFPKVTFEQSKMRPIRGAKIRKPVVQVINGALHVFTRKEWQKAMELGFRFQVLYRSIPREMAADVREQIMIHPALAKLREMRLCREADAAGEMLRGKDAH